MTLYILNVLGDGVVPLIPAEIPVESYEATEQPEVPVGEHGVRVLYGFPDGVTCIIEACDEDTAWDRVQATWPSAYVESIDIAVTFDRATGRVQS